MMTEERAREILGDAIWDMGLELDAENFVAWANCNSRAYLEGDFTPDELEAIAFWMRAHAT